MLVSRSLVVGVSVTLTALVLAGCGTRMTKAPVEDRGTSSASSSPSSVPGVVVTPIKPLPGAENAGKPGYYTVKAGDTLIRIGLENGQGWKDIARWNNLDNANLIEVGQVLRVAPPSATAATETGVVARPVASSAVVPASAASTPKPASRVPEAGQMKGTSSSDEARNKGYDISGKAGDPVLAAADGRVVYAGAGLRGYGNLVILKHNNTFLTAYAHNQALLVKEDQTVRRGQKIAEMGSTDADRVKLHFEIRRQGKPVDPVRYLPAR